MKVPASMWTTRTNDQSEGGDIQRTHFEVRRDQRRDIQGVVQLSGFVSSAAAQTRAVAVAQNVSGVKSVKDDMRLK